MATIFTIFLATSLFVSGALALSREKLPAGEITCEQLNRSTCAFSVSSSGSRCVLEKHVRGGGRKEEYSCRNSSIKAAGMAGRIETDECVAACGLERDTFGISSGSLFYRQFLQRLCSPECYDAPT